MGWKWVVWRLWRLVWGDICVRQRLKILLKVWSLLEDFDGGAKTLPKDRSTAQPWLSHRLKFAAGKRASHHIASHDASPTLSGFYRLFLFRMKKLNKKNWIFSRCVVCLPSDEPYQTKNENEPSLNSGNVPKKYLMAVLHAVDLALVQHQRKQQQSSVEGARPHWSEPT